MRPPFLAGLWYHAAAQGRETSRPPERPSARAESLDQRLDRALLTIEAIWTLLRERLQLTDEQLAQRIVELDESDGILDGKVRRKAQACPHCKKTIPGRFPRCLYCGEAVPTDHFA